MNEHPFSWNAIFRLVITGLVLYLTWYLWDVVIVTILSLMLASALYPLVRYFNKRLSLSVSAVLVMLLLFLPFIIIIFSFVPNFIDQFPELVHTLNLSLKNATYLPASVREVDLNHYLANGANYLFRSSSLITTGITTFLTIIFLTLYVLIDFKRLHQLLLYILPDDEEKKVEKLITDISVINGFYIRGNLLISLVCGICITIGLFILGVPFAVPLGLFAAIMDLLPLVGSIIGMVPAVILAFAISPTVGIFVLVLFLVYQQFENNILAPAIYKRALDLSPALSFLAVIVGTSLMGISGAFIALPIAASIPLIAQFIADRQKRV